MDSKLKPQIPVHHKRKRTAKLSPLRCSNCTKQISLARRLSPKARELRANEQRLGSGFTSGVDVVGPRTHAEAAVLLEKDDTNATFLLQGNRLSAAHILFPASTQLTPLPTGTPSIPDSQYSLAKFTLTVKEWKAYKSIVIQKRTEEQVEPISLPDPDPPGTAATQTLAVKFHPSLGTDEADVTGGDPESIKSVTFHRKALTFALSADKKTLIVRGLLAAGVTQTPTPKDLVFETKTGQKSTVTVDVVNYRIETEPASAAPAPAKPQ